MTQVGAAGLHASVGIVAAQNPTYVEPREERKKRGKKKKKKKEDEKPADNSTRVEGVDGQPVVPPIQMYTPEMLDRLPDTGWMWLVDSRSGCGKSVLVNFLLRHLSDKGGWHAAVVLSPTSQLGSYTQFGCIPKKFHHGDAAKIPEVISKIKKTAARIRKKGVDPRILVVIDDYLTGSASGIGHHGRAGLEEFVNTRRHHGVMGLIILAQNTRSCSPSIRSAVSWYITFSCRNYPQRKFVTEEYLTREPKGTRKETLAYAGALLDKAVEPSPYAACCIDLVTPTCNKMAECVMTMVAPPLEEQEEFEFQLTPIVPPPPVPKAGKAKSKIMQALEKEIKRNPIDPVLVFATDSDSDDGHQN